MSKKFEDLMNSAFPKNNSSQNQIDTKSILKEIELLTNKLSNQTADTNLYNTNVDTKEVKPFDFADIEMQVKKITVGQDKYIEDLIIAFKRPTIAGNKTKNIKNTILLTGPTGTGKKMILNQLNNQLYINNLIENKDIISIDLALYPTQNEEKLFVQDLYASLAQPNTIITFLNFDQCYRNYVNMVSQLLKNGKIILNKRYIRNNGNLIESTNTLSNTTIGSIEGNNNYLIFVTNLTIEKISNNYGQEFVKLFNDICTTTKYSEDELNLIVAKKIDNLHIKVKNNLSLTINDNGIKNFILSMYNPNLGITSLDESINRLYQAIIEIRLRHQVSELSINDLGNIVVDGVSFSINSLLKDDNNTEIISIESELADIIGLDDVKKYIISLMEHYKMNKLREAQGLKITTPSKHMIFTGNPGTGKTTIARIVAKYLKANGVLNNGQLVEVTRSDLVGRYVGHTAPLTKQMVESALGGVLFIDEAYSLYRGKDDSFGLEAIDTIVKCMEDNRDNLCVILAGYTDEMNYFLESNSGLKSRFPNIIEFDDYTGDQLLAIIKNMAKNNDYYISKECEFEILNYFNNKQLINAKESGNARMARNLIEQAIINQSKRLLVNSSDIINELKLSDFDLD